MTEDDLNFADSEGGTLTSGTIRDNIIFCKSPCDIYGVQWKRHELDASNKIDAGYLDAYTDEKTKKEFSQILSGQKGNKIIVQYNFGEAIKLNKLLDLEKVNKSKFYSKIGLDSYLSRGVGVLPFGKTKSLLYASPFELKDKFIQNYIKSLSMISKNADDKEKFIACCNKVGQDPEKYFSKHKELYDRLCRIENNKIKIDEKEIKQTEIKDDFKVDFSKIWALFCNAIGKRDSPRIEMMSSQQDKVMSLDNLCDNYNSRYLPEEGSTQGLFSVFKRNGRTGLYLTDAWSTNGMQVHRYIQNRNEGDFEKCQEEEIKNIMYELSLDKKGGPLTREIKIDENDKELEKMLKETYVTVSDLWPKSALKIDMTRINNSPITNLKLLDLDDKKYQGLWLTFGGNSLHENILYISNSLDRSK